MNLELVVLILYSDLSQGLNNKLKFLWFYLIYVQFQKRSIVMKKDSKFC